MDTEDFHAHFREYGGRLEFETLPTNAAMHFLDIKTRSEELISQGVRTKPMPRVHFDFVSNQAVNAYASMDHARMYVGMTVGAAHLFPRLFARLLADPRVLPHVGNIAVERTDLPPLPVVPRSLSELGSLAVFPIDPDRRQAERLMSAFTLDFLACHEVAHLEHGHVDYLRAHRGVLGMQEAHSIAHESEALVRQTMEMDADCAGATTAVRTCVSRIQDLSITSPPYRRFYENPTTAFLMALFSVSTFFRVFGDGGFAAQPLASNYPPIRHRQMMALGTGATFVAQFAPSLMGAFSEAVGENFNAVEIAFANLVGGSPIIDGLVEAVGRIGSGHTERLLSFWKDNLRSELLPYAYARLPA